MIPPITAAIKTPKAPTPPCSSAAGGLEKDDPDDFAEDVDADVPAEAVLPELDAVADDAAPGPDFGAPDEPGDVLVAPVCAADVFEAEAAAADPVALAALLPLVGDAVPAAPGFAAPARGPSGLVPAGFLSAEAVLPVLGIPDDGEEDEVGEGEPVAVLPGFSFTFSALRSIVTGRFAAVPEPVDGLSALPGLSAEPDPLPPDEDAPPEDLLSVAICSPPEPSGHTIHT